MKSFDTEIRRLASELRAVEQMLVQACGLAPVINDGPAGCLANWVGRVRSSCKRACQSVARLVESEAMSAVHMPQPD